MAKITLLDGGMGQELIKRSGDEPTPLWATRVMIDRPGLVEQVHRDFFAAGASVAMANTYALLPDRLERAGLLDQIDTFRAAAIAEAQSARDAHGKGRIAGCIGPLGGSYRTDMFPGMEQAVATYSEIVRKMAPEVDLIAFETLATLDTLRAALTAGQETSKPVWIAITVDDQDGTRLRSGEPVAEAAALAAEGGCAALLANCSAPEAMGPALAEMAPSGLRLGAYANAFTQITKDFLDAEATVNALAARRDMGPQRYAGFAMDWVAQGATIVGGCCETGPEHIAAIAERLRNAGHEIV
ncbi:Homocysteine S-methyltransferase [Roseivivax sp. THAF40]|uniref:homocysteine S-methyltransferase family protein n=1 Tax=unclassified Roseivivax TaxID=2639302 RepID=UPI0012695CC3|nr:MULTISPECIES: homocysteine S-methyltransferase family protein [unclassified Roseivivax]QFS84403.1 Homocysteine S-methyltransferase [Roseivivax sp. THAF197b]QFT48231.1 Homocysteine S-methyltransferase [Roseivivax sp. THAF40]